MLNIDAREARQHPTYKGDLIKILGISRVNIAENLKFGDYTFDAAPGHPTLHKTPTVGIELSSPSDLVGKITSGRFAYQLSGMIEQFDIRIFMVTSPLLCDNDGNVRLGGSPVKMPYQRVMDSLFAAQNHGVIIEYADPNRVGERIAANYKYLNKPWENHTTFRAHDLADDATIPMGSPLLPQIQTLMSFPQIGEDRAAAQWANLGSLYAIFRASEDTLAQAPGWGKILAHRFKEYIMEGV